MLDLNLIRKNPKEIKKAVNSRGLKINLDKFFELDKKRRQLQVKMTILDKTDKNIHLYYY